MSTVTHVASSATRSTDVTFKGWKLKAAMSDALEVFEGFKAGAAAVQRLARRRAKLAQPFSIDRVAAGTRHRPIGAQYIAHVGDRALRRNDAVGVELAAAFRRDP